MNKKTLKDFALLVGIVAVAAIGARFLAGGETLSDYAKKNPQAAESATAVATETADAPSNEATTELSKEPQEISTVASQDSIQVSNAADTKESSEATNESSETSSSAEGASTGISASPERITYMDGFYFEPISNEVFKRISGISYPVDCQVPLDDLRYVVLQYVDFENAPQSGEMIVNKAIAQDVVEIFYELYENGYQIESIKLVDEFGGDDTASMLANNTSSFNYRVVEGTTRLSNHALGRAIDLNPFYNPYITYNKDGSTNISPQGSEAYADRTISFPYKIDENDLAYKLFKAHGFTWGGNWNSCKDYQHFEKIR
ncbi:MAG: M15 family metallopeptidase [Butyrivibrio sp.]|nr:M15 family metallopeptidase [Butyrivibrio sp.]MBR1641737.1 M15 family metallopeptidase [Butyrivibrio sp.]